MNGIGQGRSAPGPGRAARCALVALLVAASLAVAPAAAGAATTVDFGTVSVDSTSTVERSVALVTKLSEMDPDTVLYSGGDSSIDLILATMGLSAPLTAGELYTAIGEVTATYHLTLAMATGTHFSVSAPDCLTATGSCTAQLTFAPTAAGTHTDAVTASVSDLVITGDSTYASLLDFLAPSLESSIEGSALMSVQGIGVPSTGTVAAQVDIAASAACVQLSTNAVDFGNLSLGDLDQPATPAVTITNCSGNDETLYASGTNATGDNASWSLVDSAARCDDTLGLDSYKLRLGSASFDQPVQLALAQKSVQTLTPAQGVDHELRIDTACPGSTGAGKTMTMFVNYLVVSE